MCVIDCGTAITVDAVDADGQHQGGLIVPGLEMMRGALLKHTHGVIYDMEADSSVEADLLGRNTRGCVEGGTLYAVIAFIDRVVSDLRKELGGEMQCSITGGDAPRVLPLLRGEYRHEPHLVLQGLARLAGSEGAEPAS